MALAAAMQREVTVETERNEKFELRVEKAEKSKVAKSVNIWDQMARVSLARGLKLKQSAISANSVEEAKKLMYEICFTALSARYAEMGAFIPIFSFSRWQRITTCRPPKRTIHQSIVDTVRV